MGHGCQDGVLGEVEGIAASSMSMGRVGVWGE
jgi:hypothetical protein